MFCPLDRSHSSLMTSQVTNHLKILIFLLIFKQFSGIYNCIHFEYVNIWKQELKFKHMHNNDKGTTNKIKNLEMCKNKFSQKLNLDSAASIDYQTED